MNKRLLVTGCSHGFGAVLCRALLDRGDTVIGLSRTKSKLNGDRFHWLSCDLEKITDVSQFVERNLAMLGPIDSIVLNASVQERVESQWSLDQMIRHLKVNCLGQTAIIESLEERALLAKPFKILNMSSPAAKGSPWAVAYAMSKAATDAYLQSKVKSYPDWQERPIVKTLFPGRMATPGNPKRPVPADDPNPFRDPEEIVRYALLLLDEPINGVNVIEIGGPIES